MICHAQKFRLCGALFAPISGISLPSSTRPLREGVGVVGQETAWRNRCSTFSRSPLELFPFSFDRQINDWQHSRRSAINSELLRLFWITSEEDATANQPALIYVLAKEQRKHLPLSLSPSLAHLAPLSAGTSALVRDFVQQQQEQIRHYGSLFVALLVSERNSNRAGRFLIILERLEG